MTSYKWLPQYAPYADVWEAMRNYTDARDAQTPDEIWLVEHAPVYTLGQAGKQEHILDAGGIAIVQSDRGGQVTYHGPGQIVAYCLVDLRRLKMFVKEYVHMLEDVVIGVLDELGVPGACRKPGAPGVYVPWNVAEPGAVAGGEPQLAKIAALGIKIRNGCAYHGLALNVDMDLAPFLGINPCGYEGLQTVDLRSCGIQATVSQAGELLARYLANAMAALPAARVE
ncbi:MAG TPA: lipoyl(octanoyl) transferase LipB [Candidimonas sp.]|nr:lipoyl(octanoyl) transferase LipB [Candidimonas sp.]